MSILRSQAFVGAFHICQDAFLLRCGPDAASQLKCFIQVSTLLSKCCRKESNVQISAFQHIEINIQMSDFNISMSIMRS